MTWKLSGEVAAIAITLLLTRGIKIKVKLSPKAQRLKDKLERRGHKFDTEVIDVRKAKDGRLVYWEKRTLNRHAAEFKAKGVPEHKIHEVVGDTLGYHHTTNAVHEVRTALFEGKSLYLQVKVNPNGAIGGASPAGERVLRNLRRSR
jgi:hypothetical protein